MGTGAQIGGALAITALALAASQVFAFVKYGLAKDWNGFVSSFVYFAATFGILELAQNANFTKALVIPAIGVSLRTLDLGSIVLVSLGAFGIGGFLYDRTKARDNTQSAAQPPLINSTPQGTDQPPA